MGTADGGRAPTGRVLGVALRPAPGVPAREVPAAFAPAGGGLEGDHGGSARRGVTLLARESWEAVTRGLGVSLPWRARRANLLVEGLALADLVGRRVRAGDLLLEVLGEASPCEVMDRAAPGLRAALAVPFTAGVYGRVVEGGTVRAGDAVVVVPADEA